MDFKPRVSEGLKALEDDAGSSIFIGRSKQIHEKYKRDGALLMGFLSEEQDYGKYVYLDAIAPHVVFIVGARGSGKSYSLGVIAEELVNKNPNVASIIIDPIGIYWSMKYPNQDEKEVDELIRLGLMPKGVDKVTVFIPHGVKHKLSKGMYDATFALRPADLTVDDWCLTFDIDRFSPTGLLLEKVLTKVREGYKTVDGKKVMPKQEVYSISDVIDCLSKDEELSSARKGFKADSRRALMSRFEAAKSWGIFTDEGTPLIDIAREGEVSVIDVSFLDENVSSLVIGILARKLLQARKLAARKVSMKKFTNLEELEADIPPVWLFIDEAHTLMPSGGKKTPATDALVEYVKQGRRPGCSLVFATQQPGAIDIHVLSQLDILLCHKLVFDDDVKAVMKRIPTQVPKEYRDPKFIKTIPIGHCLVGDRSDVTSRAFVMKVRPRFSQHEGRETRSVDTEEAMSDEQVIDTLVKMVKKYVSDRRRIHESTLKQIVSTVNRRYKTKIDPATIESKLLEDGYVSENGYIAAERDIDEINEEPKVDKLNKILAFKPIVTEENARGLVETIRKRKFLGIFGKAESVSGVELEYWPVYKVSYKLFKAGGYKSSVCYIDGITGELFFMHAGRLARTTGLSSFAEMSKNQRRLLIALKKGKKASAKALAAVIGVTDTTARTAADELVEKGILKYEKSGKAKYYYLVKNFNLPTSIDTLPFTGVENYLVITELDSAKVRKPIIARQYVEDIPGIYGEIKIDDVMVMYYPVYKFRLSLNGKERAIIVNGMTGRIEEAKNSLIN